MPILSFSGQARPSLPEQLQTYVEGEHSDQNEVHYTESEALVSGQAKVRQEVFLVRPGQGKAVRWVNRDPAVLEKGMWDLLKRQFRTLGDDFTAQTVRAVRKGGGAITLGQIRQAQQYACAATQIPARTGADLEGDLPWRDWMPDARWVDENVDKLRYHLTQAGVEADPRTLQLDWHGKLQVGKLPWYQRVVRWFRRGQAREQVQLRALIALALKDTLPLSMADRYVVAGAGRAAGTFTLARVVQAAQDGRLILRLYTDAVMYSAVFGEHLEAALDASWRALQSLSASDPETAGGGLDAYLPVLNKLAEFNVDTAELVAPVRALLQAKLRARIAALSLPEAQQIAATPNTLSQFMAAQTQAFVASSLRANRIRDENHATAAAYEDFAASRYGLNDPIEFALYAREAQRRLMALGTVRPLAPAALTPAHLECYAELLRECLATDRAALIGTVSPRELAVRALMITCTLEDDEIQLRLKQRPACGDSPHYPDGPRLF